MVNLKLKKRIIPYALLISLSLLPVGCNRNQEIIDGNNQAIVSSITATDSPVSLEQAKTPQVTIAPISKPIVPDYDFQKGKTRQEGEWNVVFITSDEHNPKLVGAEGHKIIKTPNIDRLAEEGTIFTNAYCAQPVCAPARQSIYTGRYSIEHAQYGNGYVFLEDNLTWAHYFCDNGYLSAVIGKTHDNNDDYNLGFDIRLEKSDKIIDHYLKGENTSNPTRIPEEDKALYDSSPDKKFKGKILSNPLGDHDGQVAEASLRFLNEHKDEKFFLHVSFIKPHWPWNSTEEYYNMYDPNMIDMPSLVPAKQDSVIYDKVFSLGWNKITEEQNRLFRARYYGNISWMDSNIGIVLDELDRLGLSDNTLVIYSSDHGDMAANKGLWLKNLMYDDAARVPLVMRMHGVIPEGRVSKELINHVDYFPTIAALINTTTEIPEYVDGHDYSEVVKGNEEGPMYTFSIDGVRKDSEPGQVMARSKQFKYIKYSSANDMLYDMINDPEETINLANSKEYAKIVQEHKEAITKFLAEREGPVADAVEY